MLILYIIIVLLCVALVTLTLIFRDYQKKSVYIPDKDKEFVEFVIDMYIQYAKDLDIHSPEQHEKIVQQLEKIKNKYFKKNE